MAKDMSLAEFHAAIEQAQKDVPAFMNECVVEEGRYARKWAVKLARQKSFNTGTYANSFHSGDRAIRTGNYYKIDVFNNLDYAKHLEYGFRSHYVPGYWAGKVFVYQPGFPGGMYVGPKGGFVKGNLVLTTAVEYTKKTQNARMARKERAFLVEHGLGAFA